MSHDRHDEERDKTVSSYNTIKRHPRSTFRYSTLMTLYFAATAVMTVIVLSIVLAVVWEHQFSSYTRTNMQGMVEQMADTLSTQYDDAQSWSDEIVDYVASRSKSMPEVGMLLVDATGKTLYDDFMGMRPSAADVMVSAEVRADVLLEDGARANRVVGTISYWPVGSDALLTKTDSTFRTRSYTAIATAATMAVIFAFVIGAFVSRRLTKPIKRITTTANQIRNGDLSARTGLSGTDEIGRLGETFDDMASTLERDIKLEHRLTSDVAHELRTPLMAIQATVEAMQDGVMPADQDTLSTLSTEVRRLSRLVDAMLRLSRMENGKTPLRVERCDVVALASDIVTVHSQLFQDNGIELSYQNETGHHEFFAQIDPDLIREAVVNLLSNALRYTSEGGTVSLRVGRDRHNVLISVQDTGMGIAKEDIPRVFSRFWRSDASRERVAGGLGVGLSLTKEIVDRHNGTISVDSKEGVGTTFTLRLPTTHHESAKGHK